MKNPFLKEILLSNINSLLGSLLLGSIALGASLVIWQASFGNNPLVQAFSGMVASQTHVY